MSIYIQPDGRAATVLANRGKILKPLAAVFIVALSAICFVSAVKLLDAISKIVAA